MPVAEFFAIVALVCLVLGLKPKEKRWGIIYLTTVRESGTMVLW